MISKLSTSCSFSLIVFNSFPCVPLLFLFGNWIVTPGEGYCKVFLQRKSSSHFRLLLFCFLFLLNLRWFQIHRLHLLLLMVAKLCLHCYCHPEVLVLKIGCYKHLLTLGCSNIYCNSSLAGYR